MILSKRLKLTRPSSLLGSGVLAVLWLAIAHIGFFNLDRYATIPGKTSEPVGQWPCDSRLPFEKNALNLVVAVHPRCPCTQASLDELDRLLAECRRHVRVHVLLWQPKGATLEWEHTERCEQAQRLPGAWLYPDEAGVEARRFSAKTSGQMLLYGEEGELLFCGGITAARGMMGDNANREALRQRILGESRFVQVTPVFGCPLD